MHPGNGCGNFTIGMIFLIEVSHVLWATGIYWIPGASLHGQLPVFSRSWEGTLLSGHWWGVVSKQQTITIHLLITLNGTHSLIILICNLIFFNMQSLFIHRTKCFTHG